MSHLLMMIQLSDSINSIQFSISWLEMKWFACAAILFNTKILLIMANITFGMTRKDFERSDNPIRILYLKIAFLNLIKWPNVYKLPSYCNGQCMATTKKIADSIYKTASITDRHEFRIEDIYYTGIMRKKAGLPGPKSITGQRFINKIVKTKTVRLV